MTLSTEELIAANNNGSLESLLQGYSLSSFDVLQCVLKDVSNKLQELEEEYNLLEEAYACLEEEM